MFPGANFLPSGFQDMREDVNMLVGHNWAESSAATARQSNERAMERSMDFNSAEAAKQRGFAEHMSNTAYQRSMNDMHRAGLNPMLAAKQGGADSPSGSSASVSGTSATPAVVPRAGSAGSQGSLLLSQIALNSAAVARTEAETRVAGATEDEIRARTPTHASSIQVMQQNIRESVERTTKLIAETSATRQGEATSAAHADNLAQQTRNLKEIVPQIRATIEQLRAHTKLTGSQDVELRQRIAANLPHLEGVLKDLERSIVEMSLPGHRNEQAAAESMVGQLKAYLKGLLPLQGIFGSVPLGRGGAGAPKYKPNPANQNPPR